MAITASGQGRRYGGASATERRDDRRDRLIRAAITLYGEQGYRRTTVSAVCRAAGLTPRYFYEAFDNSEALLATTFRQVIDFVTRRVAAAAEAAGGTPAERLSALLTAYYDIVCEEPDSARVFVSEISGIDARIDALMDQSMTTFADLIARTLDADHVDGTIEPLRRTGAMQGLLNVVREWVGGGCREPIASVVRIVEPLCYMLVDGKRPGI